MPATQTPPPLAPPGAGIPWYERLVARHVVFPLARRRLDWASAGRLFRDEGARILAVWDALPPDRLTERVLVPRLQGMEDSSRHWSVAMTVEHLNIVGHSIRALIAGLRRGEQAAVSPRTQDVKPTGGVLPAEVRRQFEALLAGDDGPAVPRGQGVRTPHPWFGPLDMFGWHCLLAVHQGIHRKQAEAIRAGL